MKESFLMRQNWLVHKVQSFQAKIIVTFCLFLTPSQPGFKQQMNGNCTQERKKEEEEERTKERKTEASDLCAECCWKWTRIFVVDRDSVSATWCLTQYLLWTKWAQALWLHHGRLSTQYFFCGFVSSWLFVMLILTYAFIVLMLFWMSSGFWCW